MVAAGVWGSLFVAAVALSDIPTAGPTGAPGARGLALQDLKTLLLSFRSLPMAMFSLVVFAMGAAMAVAASFQLVFLRSLGASGTLLGLTVLMSVMAEIPLFFFTGWLLERFGACGMLTFAVVAYATRFGGFCLLTDPWYVLILEPLHGASFACFWTAGVTHMAAVAPPSLQTTAQGLFFALTCGLGPLLGNLGGGALYERGGAVALFAVSAATLFAVAIAFLATERPWASPQSAGSAGGSITPQQSSNKQTEDYEELEPEGIPPDVHAAADPPGPSEPL